MKTTFEMIKDLQDEKERLQTRYLQENEWYWTCSFPDSRGRWVKDDEHGNRMTLSADDACRMQSDFDPQMIECSECKAVFDIRSKGWLCSVCEAPFCEEHHKPANGECTVCRENVSEIKDEV